MTIGAHLARDGADAFLQKEPSRYFVLKTVQLLDPFETCLVMIHHGLGRVEIDIEPLDVAPGGAPEVMAR